MKNFAFVFAVFLTAFILSISVFAQDATTGERAPVTTTTAYEDTILNPCNGGEQVHVVGKMTATADTFINSAGRLHDRSYVVEEGVGVGLSTGSDYIYRAQTMQINEKDDTDQQPSIFTSVAKLKIISKGSAPNFSAYVNNHITTNANGTLTADHSFAGTECKGN